LLHVQAPHDEAGVPTDLSGAIGLGERSALLEKLAQVDASRAKLDQQKGKLILEHAEARLMAAGVGQIDALHRRGSLVETIAEFEGATQLIVIGKRGEAADLARLHLGSNLERVVRAAHRPVLVAARAFQPIRRFMLAYDGGASTRKAVAYVASSPLFRGLTCHLLKVGADNGANRADLAAAATTLQQAGLDVQPQLQAGHADDVIAAAVQTEQTDLLVMGAYGHSHMRTLIIGSTTSTMLRSCPIPVLLFR
jgi:nucleotide-binding universal stress UspA family protein